MRITIEGIAGEGKTTMAILLSEFLKQKGFTNVDIDDFDVIHESHAPDLQEHRVEAIKDRKILIKTLQLKRTWKEVIEPRRVRGAP